MEKHQKSYGISIFFSIPSNEWKSKVICNTLSVFIVSRVRCYSQAITSLHLCSYGWDGGWGCITFLWMSIPKLPPPCDHFDNVPDDLSLQNSKVSFPLNSALVRSARCGLFLNFCRAQVLIKHLSLVLLPAADEREWNTSREDYIKAPITKGLMPAKISSIASQNNVFLAPFSPLIFSPSKVDVWLNAISVEPRVINESAKIEPN